MSYTSRDPAWDAEVEGIRPAVKQVLIFVFLSNIHFLDTVPTTPLSSLCPHLLCVPVSLCVSLGLCVSPWMPQSFSMDHSLSLSLSGSLFPLSLHLSDVLPFFFFFLLTGAELVALNAQLLPPC